MKYLFDINAHTVKKRHFVAENNIY